MALFFSFVLEASLGEILASSPYSDGDAVSLCIVQTTAAGTL